MKVIPFDLPMTIRFRGIARRQGILVHGPAGWAEWSPFAEYTYPEIGAWWRATREAAVEGFPTPVRDRVGVNVTIGIMDAEAAHARAGASGCRTAKIKVAEPGVPFVEDVARVEAVRDALGPAGRVRVDANGAWSVDEAERALRALARFDLEYAEQPCRTVEELRELRMRLARSGVDVRIAADESIRRSGDPERVAELEAADVAVLKVQPLGGVRACLELAEKLGMPVVVSSALETSVGIRAGVALAAALPELPFDCGLNTVDLLQDDVAIEPLVAVGGFLPVRDVEVRPVEEWDAGDAAREHWERRLATLPQGEWAWLRDRSPVERSEAESKP